MASDLSKVSFDWNDFKITLFFVKPYLDGRKTYLTKRLCHTFLNYRPVIIQNRIISVFFELYGEYRVGLKSMPFVMLHMETDDHSQYELKLHLDMR